MTLLATLRALTDDEVMVKACAAELKRIRELEGEILALRNEGIRRLSKTRTLAEVGIIADVNKSTVKWINGPR